MTVQFNYNRNQNGEESLLVVGEVTRVIAASHPNFLRIRDYLLNNTDADINEVLKLADVARNISDKLVKLSDRVALRGESIYFDGEPIETRLSKHIVEMVKNDDDNYVGYVAFLENLATNPRKSSRNQLFKFLDKHDLIITPEGHFIGYKGVQNVDENLSVSAGKEPVFVTVDGETTEHTGHIPNPVGATVEMARSLVNDNRDRACSVGLHIGNHRYAAGFGQKLLTVSVNPRDVVSVPSDSNDEKIRACKYTVLEVNAHRTAYTGTSYTPPVDEDEEDETTCYDCGEPSDGTYCDGCNDEYDDNRY